MTLPEMILNDRIRLVAIAVVAIAIMVSGVVRHDSMAIGFGIGSLVTLLLVRFPRILTV